MADEAGLLQMNRSASRNSVLHWTNKRVAFPVNLTDVVIKSDREHFPRRAWRKTRDETGVACSLYVCCLPGRRVERNDTAVRCPGYEGARRRECDCIDSLLRALFIDKCRLFKIRFVVEGRISTHADHSCRFIAPPSIEDVQVTRQGQ